jgi:hypothetical protein
MTSEEWKERVEELSRLNAEVSNVELLDVLVDILVVLERKEAEG